MTVYRNPEVTADPPGTSFFANDHERTAKLAGGLETNSPTKQEEDVVETETEETVTEETEVSPPVPENVLTPSSDEPEPEAFSGEETSV